MPEDIQDKKTMMSHCKARRCNNDHKSFRQHFYDSSCAKKQKTKDHLKEAENSDMIVNVSLVLPGDKHSEARKLMTLDTVSEEQVDQTPLFNDSNKRPCLQD